MINNGNNCLTTCFIYTVSSLYIKATKQVNLYFKDEQTQNLRKYFSRAWFLHFGNISVKLDNSML